MDAAQLHLGFSAGGEALSVPAFQVAEVARVPACTRVPNAPAALVGLASLRGIVLPVVSLAVLLGRTQAAATAQSRLLVVAGAAPVGVLVDQVTSLGATGGGRDPDIRALLDAAFAGLRRRPAAVPATLPGARPDEAPGPAQAAAPLALVGLLVAGQEYALRLHDVSAILRLPAARAHVPGLDAAMLGVMPYEGGTLPLVSLAALLGLPDGIAAATRVVVTAIQGMRLGLVVDAVTGTLALAAGRDRPGAGGTDPRHRGGDAGRHLPAGRRRPAGRAALPRAPVRRGHPGPPAGRQPGRGRVSPHPPQPTPARHCGSCCSAWATSSTAFRWPRWTRWCAGPRR